MHCVSGPTRLITVTGPAARFVFKNPVNSPHYFSKTVSYATSANTRQHLAVYEL